VLADPKNQGVYNKTVFILNYDEGGQFFDHHWTPTPPTRDPTTGLDVDGASTVTTDGEVIDKPPDGNHTGFNAEHVGKPIGLGYRVPFFIISPWTRGNLGRAEEADVGWLGSVLLVANTPIRSAPFLCCCSPPTARAHTHKHTPMARAMELHHIESRHRIAPSNCTISNRAILPRRADMHQSTLRWRTTPA
jgi:hypothetical protein